MPQPAEATTEQYSGALEADPADPLLFQGSRFRAETSNQAGASGNGSAEYSGTAGGEVKEDKNFLDGGFRYLRLHLQLLVDRKLDLDRLCPLGAAAERTQVPMNREKILIKYLIIVQLRGAKAPAASSVKDSFHESANAMLDVLARSMTQLQDMQAKNFNWDHITGLAGADISGYARSIPFIWRMVGESDGCGQKTYAKWLGSTPLERIQLQPQGHLGLSTGKWTRVNARACTMLLQSLTDAVKQDLIARRVVQHATLIMFRLHTVYQPGGASEKTLVLNSLQSPAACETLDDVLVWLRSWPRWIQRCQDLSMQCPDGTVLAKALSSATAKFIVESGDAQFRTQLLRSTLRIDGQPSLDDVKRYHQHLQAELEAVSVSRTIPTTPTIPTPPKVRMATTTGANDKAGTSPTSGTTTTKQPCKYFFKQTGCRRGAKCPYGHDMNTLSKAERSKKCLCCGSEEHRQRECPTKNPKAPARASSSSATTGNSSATTSSTTPRVNRMEPEGEASPVNSSPQGVITGEPVWTLESLLEAASKVASAKAAASSPSLNVVSLRAHYPIAGQCCTFALVDSGAKHALRRAESEEEWQCADPVIVNLAGGESVALRINQAGTILVPLVGPASSASAPIVPLGALVGQLGYSMMWSGTRCRLEGRNGEVLNLRVRDGCPEIAERDALRLIAMLEDKQLQELKNNTAITKRKVKAAAMMMERTWFDHLQSYTTSSISTEALKAVEAAPFFRDVPKQCLAGLAEAVPELNGWEALKSLEHLNRRTRKRLWSSDKWLVHLFAGEKEKKDWAHLERAGYTILELDITRGRTHDVLRPSTWRVLEYAARKGKIAAIIGGPPQGTFMISRYNVNGPRPLRTNEYPYGGVLGWSTMGEVDKDKYEEQDDGLNVDQAEAEKESIRPIEAVEEEQGEEEANKKLDPEEDLDLAPPELVNLIFSTGLRDDKSATVLEAIQDVVLYCQSLNIPVLRFHSDRGMEYQARAVRQWLKGQGIRVYPNIYGRQLYLRRPLFSEQMCPIADVVEADEPAGPSHRVRGKASGSGDVVTVSKAVIFEDEEYKQRAEKILDSWSQEEAEVLVKEVGSLLPPAESVYGMFRHGGRTGITRATAERPWFAQLLIRLLRDRASDAEFASIYLSVNSEREVHIDRNNAMGTLNYVLPIVMPRRGGEIWQELRNGDTVSGRISELTSPDGKVRYGCAFPLQEGCVFHLNPHRRHAVLPYKGDRVVVVGYTPGVLQNVTRTDREFLWTLGFPMPLVDEDGGGGIRISMLSVGKDLEADLCAFPFSQEEPIAKESTVEDTQGPTSFCEVQHEEWADWEMRLLLDQDQKETVLVESDVMKPLGIYKTEVSYTENIEQLLEALDGPLSIVHTVSPKDAADHFEKWVPSLEKEIASLAHAVQKAHVDDVEVKRDVETGKGQMIPMKVVFTVKPPDVTQDGASATSFFKRKSRIVICGNLATHQPGDVYTNTAPAEVVRAAIALARFFRWNLGMIDVVAAFLQTPLKELSGAPLVYGIPPKILIKAGLCRPGELWKLTHAVYGLQESPNLWGTYRDQRLAGITFMLGDKTITLVQGKVEPSWWSVMQDGTMLVGILVVYVDDLLICGEADVIKGVTAAIRSLWKTSDLQLVSEGTIRFLGIEISEYK
ncbi:unnamed protein product, partial [Symbiodinium microadriaticum]